MIFVVKASIFPFCVKTTCFFVLVYWPLCSEVLLLLFLLEGVLVYLEFFQMVVEEEKHENLLISYLQIIL